MCARSFDVTQLKAEQFRPIAEPTARGAHRSGATLGVAEHGIQRQAA
jgi:hypothetical protein